MMEVWKDIIGFNGYQVSNFGNVKSVDRQGTYKRRGKIIFYKERGRSIKPNSTGRYLRAALTVNGITKHLSIHRLVAIAFIDNPQNKPCVNHIDGNRLNNNVDNLEWVSYQENMRHAYSTGLIDILKIGKHSIGNLPKNSKVVLDTETGIFYNSSMEVERVFGFASNTLRSKLNGARFNDTKFIYC